jgi:hypothetical protein
MHRRARKRVVAARTPGRQRPPRAVVEGQEETPRDGLHLPVPAAAMRSRLLRVAALVLVVVAVLVAALAVLTVVTAPLVIALELAAVAVVTGVATHRRRSRRRRAAAAPPPSEPEPGPAASSEVEWTTTWPDEPVPESVPGVRDKLACVLSGWGLSGEAGEPTLLVVTELLDNVTAHGRGPTRLLVRLVGDGVRVEVTDASPDPPELGPRDPAGSRGRGLVIVDGLALRWGWTGAPPGKTIWAVVPPSW